MWFNSTHYPIHICPSIIFVRFPLSTKSDSRDSRFWQNTYNLLGVLFIHAAHDSSTAYKADGICWSAVLSAPGAKFNLFDPLWFIWWGRTNCIHTPHAPHLLAHNKEQRFLRGNIYCRGIVEEEETSCTHTADTYMIMITYESYDYLEMKKRFGC